MNMLNANYIETNKMFFWFDDLTTQDRGGESWISAILFFPSEF